MAPNGKSRRAAMREANQKAKDFPERLSEEQLCKVLQDMNLDAADVTQLGDSALRSLFARAVAKMQGLPSPARSKPDINPLRVTGTVDPTDFPHGFHEHFAFRESPSERSQQDVKGGVFRRYRQILEQLSHLRDAGSCPYAFLSDSEGIVALQITIRGLRLFPPDIVFMELQYLCATRQHIQTPQWSVYQAAVAASMAGAGCGPPMKITVSVLEALFIKEVLTKNAVRLDPEYVHFCTQHWALTEQNQIKVSFLVPATPLSKHQIEHLQARCASGDCGQPAQMTCVRCQRVKYCSKECQKTHWKQHKAQCFCACCQRPYCEAKSSDKKIKEQAAAAQAARQSEC